MDGQSTARGPNPARKGFSFGPRSIFGSLSSQIQSKNVTREPKKLPTPGLDLKCEMKF